MLKFERVSFRYNAKSETSFNLKGVSFFLQKSVINGLIGSNGCGKSTVARLIVGLLEPSEGEISFPDENSQSSAYYFPGLIFQNPDNQIVGTTVGDDIAFGLENLNLHTSVIQDRVIETSALFGFDSLLDMPVSQLSGGQKQMLCILSVIALRPSWIIFDEPTAHLDPWARKNFWRIAEFLAKEKNFGILIISQLPSDIEKFEHICVFNSGELVYNDSSVNFKELKETPKGVDFPDSWKLETLLNGN